MNDLEQKLRDVQTMPELDALRPECVEAMRSKPGQTSQDNEANFNYWQRLFRRAKNRLRAVPIRDRTW